MLVLAVVAEALAVVGEKNDERAVVEAARLQKRDEAPHDLVGGRDLAVVGALRVAALEGLRRLVRRVRLVEMEEGEHGLAGRSPGDPGLQPALRLASPALHLPDRLAGRRRLDRVVPEGEPARDARRMIEHDRGDRPARRVAARGQKLGERRVRGVEPVADVVAHAVLERKQARQQRDVRRQRQRHVRNRVLEDERVLRERVERGRLDAAVAVGREMIRAQRVHGDQEDGRPREDEGSSGAGGRGEQGRRGRREGGQEEAPDPGRAGRPAVHCNDFKSSLTVSASPPLGASSRYFFKSALASAFFLSCMRARPR